MQYQPLLKKIKAAISNNDMKGLLDMTSNDWVMVYLNTDKIFQNSFTVESKYWDLYDNDEILNLNFPLKQSSAACVSYRNGDEFQNALELSHENGLEDSLMWPLFFWRSSYKGGKLCDHYELLQNFVHINGVFLNSKDSTYTLINDAGDVEVKAIMLFEPGLKLILFERKVLDYYLGYSDHFLVRFFELAELDNIQEWKIDKLNNPLIKRRVYHYEKTSMCKGAEIIKPIYTIEQIQGGEPKKYESFIIHDYKHDQIIEQSSAA